MLRKETYADDGSANAHLPYEVVDVGNMVQKGVDRSSPAVFYPYQRENLVHIYECDLTNPRIEHEIAL